MTSRFQNHKDLHERENRDAETKGFLISVNQTGIRGFCAEEDAVVRVDPAGACSTEAGILVFNPLNQ